MQDDVPDVPLPANFTSQISNQDLRSSVRRSLHLRYRHLHFDDLSPKLVQTFLSGIADCHRAGRGAFFDRSRSHLVARDTPLSHPLPDGHTVGPSGSLYRTR
jgi:hypothetical protein